MVRTRCRGFLRYCAEAKWLAHLPNLPKIRIDVAPTMPLDEDSRLLEATGTTRLSEPAATVWALLPLMRWSGLSIRDALTLPTRRPTKSGDRHRIVTNRQKTGTDVSVIIPASVAEEVLAVTGTKYLFWDGKTDILKSWTKYVMAPCSRKPGSNETGT